MSGAVKHITRKEVNESLARIEARGLIDDANLLRSVITGLEERVLGQKIELKNTKSALSVYQSGDDLLYMDRLEEENNGKEDISA